MSKIALPAWANHGPIKARNTENTGVTQASGVTLGVTGGVTRAAELTGSASSLPSSGEQGSIPSGRSRDRHKLGQAAYMRAYRARKKAEAK